MRRCIGYFLMALALVGCVASRPETGLKVVLLYPDAANSKVEAVWIANLLGRASYVNAHEDRYRHVTGLCAPQFDEEVEARSSAAKVYLELSDQDPKLHDPYFVDLTKVEKAGYGREHVWTFLRQPTWPETQQPSELRDFDSWASENIPDPKVATIGSISIHQK
jgi:hypothetical protein